MNEYLDFGYWNYFSEDFDWLQSPRHNLVCKQHTLDVFRQQGLNESEAMRLWDSGYVCPKWHNIIIDRYYGGAISSFDGVTRFMPSQIQELFRPPMSRVWTKSASSLDDLYKIIEDTQSRSSKPLRFRGQRQHYFIDREVHNPHFTIDGLGEISMLSSFWRRVFSKTKHSFIDFESLSLMEWGKIFFTAYDIEEIERRRQAYINKGEWIYSMQDMADSGDPLLREFGNLRLDLAMGMNFNLADTLSTLLQHYGLLSTVIDLTSTVDVALFFATHKYAYKDDLSTYEFIGTNEGKSIIYVLRGNEQEMVTHAQDRVLEKIPPERPKRQHCVVSRSAPLAVNLPTFFLEGIVNLDFPLKANESPKRVKDLFPGEESDKFLKAIRQGLLYPNKVSYFGNC